MILVAIYKDNDTFNTQLISFLNSFQNNHKKVQLSLSFYNDEDKMFDNLIALKQDYLIILDNIKEDSFNHFLNTYNEKNLDSEVITLADNSNNKYAVNNRHIVFANDENSFGICLENSIKTILNNRIKNNYLTINSVEGLIDVNYNNIIFIEQKEKRLYFYLNNGQVIKSRTIRLSMNDYLKELLKDNSFVRCHSAFIINLNKVIKADKNNALMVKGHNVPIAKQRSKDVLTAYSKFRNKDTFEIHLNSAIQYCLNHNKQLEFLNRQPFAQCIIRIDVDSDGNPFDFVFMYVNDMLCQLEGKTSQELMGASFYDVFNNGDSKWLAYYYDSAYKGITNQFISYSPEINAYLNIICYQVEVGYCGCILNKVE